jgi:cardiolipin synthase
MTIPNLLSLFRLALVPLFPIVFFSHTPHSRLYAILIYGLASFTDVLDGCIARRYQMVSRLGRILDPLADKLMAFTVLTCIAWARIIPYWAVLIFFCKEALMGLGALTLYQKTEDVMPSNWLGKGAGATFFIICVCLMLFPQIPHVWATVLICIALALNIAAFLNYLWIFIFKMNESNES